jgi:hypothetical protein
VNQVDRPSNTAQWWPQPVYTTTLAGIFFGVFEGVRRGWADGLLGGVLFGLLFGGLTAWRRRRTTRLISRLASRAGVRYEDLSRLGTRIRDGEPPESAEEAAALRRFVDYRRRSLARLPWAALAMTLPLAVLGGVGLAKGAIVPGVLLLLLACVLACAMLLIRRGEPGRLDRMDALLATYSSSPRGSEPDGPIADDD